MKITKLVSIFVLFTCSQLLLSHPVKLKPVRSGGVRDLAPQDGFGDVFTDRAFIYNNENGKASAAVLEFDLTYLTTTPFKEVSLQGLVYGNNHLDTGMRNVDVEWYEGDGVLNPSDYEQMGTKLGEVSYRPPVDKNVSFEYDVTDVVQDLLSQGKTLLTIRFFPLNHQAPSAISQTISPPVLVVQR